MRDSQTKLVETHKLGAETREWVVLSHRGELVSTSTMHVAGHTYARVGFEFVRKDPSFGLILVSESGEGLVLVGERWVDCPPGHAYVCSPRALHAYHIGASGQWRVHWLIYGEALFIPGLEAGNEARLVELEAGALRHSIEGLCHEHGAGGDAGMLALWTDLVDRYALSALQLKKGEGRLDRLWQAVRADLGGDWTVGRMSALLGMGEENLRRICQEQLQTSPMAELSRLRMEAACVLLKYSREKVSAISLRVGYADAFAFSTAFRRRLGISPKAYRLKQGNSII